MSLTFTGYKNNKADNVADKELETISGYNGISVILKDSTSVQKPTILLRQTSNVPVDLNYFYISEFKRYYFVTDIKVVRNDLIEISGRTDVLTTAFKRKDANGKSLLGKCQGIVYRSEKKYNLYIDDGYFKVKNYPDVQTHPFSKTFDKHSFVMMIAGN